MGIKVLRKRLIVFTVVLDLFMSKTVCQRMSVTARSIQSRSWSHIEWKVSRDLGTVGAHIQTLKKHYHMHQFKHSFKGFKQFHSGILLFLYSEPQHLFNTAFQACEVNQWERYVNSNQQQAEFLKAELKWSVW